MWHGRRRRREYRKSALANHNVASIQSGTVNRFGIRHNDAPSLYPHTVLDYLGLTVRFVRQRRMVHGPRLFAQFRVDKENVGDAGLFHTFQKPLFEPLLRQDQAQDPAGFLYQCFLLLRTLLIPQAVPFVVYWKYFCSGVVLWLAYFACVYGGTVGDLCASHSLGNSCFRNRLTGYTVICFRPTRTH